MLHNSSLTQNAGNRNTCSYYLRPFLMHKHAHELVLPACVGRIPKRHVQPSCLVHDALLVAKRIEALASMVLPHTARAHAAKAHMARSQVHDRVVDTGPAASDDP